MEKHKIELTDQQLSNLRAFLDRVDTKGINESVAYFELLTLFGFVNLGDNLDELDNVENEVSE